MFKPLVFTSLYALAGFSGWQAYSVITEEDTSLTALTAFAKTTNEQIINSVSGDDNHIYRQKNEDGQWVYSNQPIEKITNSNYEQELEFLKSLPQEAMPTSSFKTSPQLVSMIEKAAAVTGENKISKLMEEAKKVAAMLEERNKLLDSFNHKEDN